METRKELKDFNPMEQEILQVYWSDHCRHTTFNTHITDIKVEGDDEFVADINKSLEAYKSQRKLVHGAKLSKKPITLMDLATISAKFQKAKNGLTNHVDDKIEYNACTIMTTVNGKEYRLSFKNETHNSPTEKYPYDGAATALGGTIRDILASRAVPYQGIRVTGCADPTAKETMAGKLPQKQITTLAAKGFSEYARTAGAVVGKVQEFYHPGYVAKRMEGGLVAGCVEKSNARVEELVPGDIILLIGLKTGRDGIGAAADSSTTQDKVSISACPIGYPEVGKRLIELYRNPKFLRLVKKCNDFGAGGVSVAVGELAASLDIYLDRVPLSVKTLTPTEIAISETQERMAVGIAKKDLKKVLELTAALDLETTVVADVTDTGFMNMFYGDDKVASFSRAFLDTAGDIRTQEIIVNSPSKKVNPFDGKTFDSFRETVLGIISDLENCSQQGVAQKFDQTDSSTVLAPFDGKFAKSPTQGSVMLVPVKNNKTRVTIAACGFDPYVSSWSSYYGGITARLDSVARVIAMGGDYRDIYFTDQEYYGTCSTPEKFGRPFAALLGANDVCRTLGIAAVGGKDSMSGSYGDVDVPPALISYAFCPADIKTVTSQTFKNVDSQVGIVEINYKDLSNAKKKWDYFMKLRSEGNILTARAIGPGGVLSEVCNASFGNKIGFTFGESLDLNTLNAKSYGSILFELKDGVKLDNKLASVIGKTTAEKTINYGSEKILIDDILKSSEARLEKVFPIKA